MENACLTTNAHTTEGLLYWSYGISNRSGVKSIDLDPQTRGSGKVRMEDLRMLRHCAWIGKQRRLLKED